MSAPDAFSAKGKACWLGGVENTKWVRLACSKQQHQDITQAAKLLNLTVSDYIRKSLGWPLVDRKMQEKEFKRAPIKTTLYCIFCQKETTHQRIRGNSVFKEQCLTCNERQ